MTIHSRLSIKLKICFRRNDNVYYITRHDLLAPPAYLRLLGANEQGRAFLAQTRKSRTVPVVTKAADVKALGEAAARAQELERIAQGLYALCLPQPVLPAELAALPPKML